MAHGLGIDTGGTFTDAVLLDEHQRVVARAKSLTTHFDLAQGIGGALAQLPQDALQSVNLVCLSTTLTTNSVVEGKGAPVCVLLAGYDEQQIKTSGLIELLGRDAIVSLAGGHDAAGQPLCALDEAAAKAAIQAQVGRVSAFAISGTFAVRNRAHEMQLRAWVRECCDKPITCGHELASSLGAPRRALTTALNARMIPFIQRMIESVRATLKERGIDAPLMVVKGDGSLVNVQSALQRPVATVLSGPAASVLGACALAGTQNAIMADMGGTTTDIAVVRNGTPALSEDGALIGQWRPMVEAVKIYAIGLGGDSEVRFQGGAGMTIGPRRVLPVSLLVHQHPHVLAVLERQQNETPHASQMRFALQLQSDPTQLQRLADDERIAWDRLAQGPLDIERANIENRPLARAVARLERKGMAIYSGFTPSDAAHVMKLCGHWSREGAVLAARIWARQMRHLYGLGKWALGDEFGPSQQVMDQVIDGIAQKLIEAGLNDAGQMNEQNAGKMASLLTQMALHRRSATSDQAAPVFQLQFAPGIPLIAVGAPSHSYYPTVAREMGIELISPPHADVANAVGAVLGRVVQRVHLLVTQPSRGVFRLFGVDGPEDHNTLPAAFEAARQACAQMARAQAIAAGADEEDLTLAWIHDENSVSNDIDGDVFFEARVGAVASAKPRRNTARAH
jgi:N-methylhydantoinase A/oxoprolinase/acetone carboxylase beta subunit